MSKSTKASEPTDKLLPKISLFFFDRPKFSLLLLVSLFIFGIFSYTTLLKREGFPSVSIPIVVVSGTYMQDGATVDQTLAKPISDLALKQDGVTGVNTSSQASFFQATILYEESVKPEAAKKSLEAAIDKAGVVPEGARLQIDAPYFGVTGGSTEKIDATVSMFNAGDTVEAQYQTAEKAVKYLNTLEYSQVDKFFVDSPFETIISRETGQPEQVQSSFDRYGKRAGDQTVFNDSIIIGVAAVQNGDVIKLDDQVRDALSKLQNQPGFANVQTEVSGSFAPQIKENISELQRVLIEGLIAVLIVGSIVIAIRASFITVMAMVSVIAITLSILFLAGFSLNVITLFAIILGLSLIVDDTIIMVEALDAARRRHKTARAAVRDATRKISRAMVAATLTAAFSFVPLLFVTGILGSFIRAIPVTIISALLTSLVVALVFIPVLARYILLGKKQLGSKGKVIEVAAGVENKIATAVGRPMLWSKGSRARQVGTGLTAVAISLIFIGAAGFLFTKVTFNIFPSSKDTNQIAVNLTFPAGTSLERAQAITSDVDTKVANIVGDAYVDGSYYGMANSQTANMSINLTSYSKRDVTAPQLVEKINSQLDGKVGAAVNAYQIDAGPPASGFTTDITATNREQSAKLAEDLAAFLKTETLERPSGEIARFTDVSVANTDNFTRSDGRPTIGVTTAFDGTDTSTLTVLAQSAIKEEFDADRLAEYGLSTGDVSFDLGQESENQDSFKSLALAFPIVIIATFILLAVQFRSLLQPLLIFMAVPFSLFGVAFGLYITDNPISFFALLGFFALIGLSIKNTILLTDYANQSRRAGMGAIDAVVAALHERFRPLIATSLTAIFSLIPLAITSPFWESLAFTLIFGLASSTILVILVFPYYYLGGEFVRMKTGRLIRRIRSR